MLKEKNAELLFQMAAMEQQLSRVQRGYEIVYCLLPRLKIAETTIHKSKKLCPDITFTPKEFI